MNRATKASGARETSRDAARVFLAAAVAVLCAPPSLADLVTTKDGVVIEGKIVERKEASVCPDCRGTGTAEGKTCRRCKGQGHLPGFLRIKVSAGVIHTVPLEDVASVVKRPVAPETLMRPEKAYEVVAESTDPLDAEANLRLARWCVTRGLEDKAWKHFSRAVSLDESLSHEVEPAVRVLRARRDRRATAAFRASMELCKKNDYAAAARALKEVRESFPDALIFSDPDLRRRIMERSYPEIAARFGTEENLLRRRLLAFARFACHKCSGKGAVVCSACGGVCRRCRGTGTTSCPHCRGSGNIICTKCNGTGKVRISSGFASWVVTCDKCGGDGIARCPHCKGGRIACPECGGKGTAGKQCKVCGGTGFEECSTCVGTGFRLPERLHWGPVPMLDPRDIIVTPERDFCRVFQGKSGNCVITLVDPEHVFLGALRARLQELFGDNFHFMVACVDNRKGNTPVTCEPSAGVVKLVTEQAEQIASVDVLAAKPEIPQRAELTDLLARLSPVSILPGVVHSTILVFPGTIDSGSIRTAYWESSRLDPYFVPVSELQRSAASD